MSLHFIDEAGYHFKSGNQKNDLAFLLDLPQGFAVPDTTKACFLDEDEPCCALHSWWCERSLGMGTCRMSLLGLGPGSWDRAAGLGREVPPSLHDAPGVVIGFTLLHSSEFLLLVIGFIKK